MDKNHKSTFQKTLENLKKSRLVSKKLESKKQPSKKIEEMLAKRTAALRSKKIEELKEKSMKTIKTKKNKSLKESLFIARLKKRMLEAEEKEDTAEAEESQEEIEKEETPLPEEQEGSEETPAPEALPEESKDEVVELDDFIASLSAFAQENGLSIDNVSEKHIGQKVTMFFTISNEQKTVLVAYDGTALTFNDLGTNSSLNDTVDSLEEFFSKLKQFFNVEVPVSEIPVEEKLQIKGELPELLAPAVGQVKECFDDLLLGNTGLDVCAYAEPEGSVCIDICSDTCTVTIKIKDCAGPVDVISNPISEEPSQTTLPGFDPLTVLDASIDALNFSERAMSTKRLFIKKSEALKPKKSKRTESKKETKPDSFNKSESYQIKRFLEGLFMPKRIVKAFEDQDFKTVISAIKELKG